MSRLSSIQRQDSNEKYAVDLLRKTCFSYAIRPKSLVIHQDNGS